MNYYSFHVGDYRGATAHLNNEEDLCYRRILDLYYDKDGVLPDLANISRRVRIPVEIVTSILEEFFVFNGGTWCNPRADKEINDFRAFSKAGKKGAKARWGSDDPPITPPSIGHMAIDSPPIVSPLATTSHSPLPTSQQPITNTQAAEPAEIKVEASGRNWAEEFESFWKLYPENRKTNRYRAQTEWSAVRLLLPTKNELEAALCAFKASPEWKRDDGKYIPAPHVFLSERRWQDAPAFSPKAKSKPKPEVDEEDALRWRLETYPVSGEIHPRWQSFPFKQWPEETRREYREAKSQLQPA
jgi:hypothetical protein